MEKHPAHLLGDLFVALKILCELMERYMSDCGSIDYENRFHSQSLLMVDNLKKVKIGAESLISEGYKLFKVDESPVSTNTKSKVQSDTSEEVATGERASNEES